MSSSSILHNEKTYWQMNPKLSLTPEQWKLLDSLLIENSQLPGHFVELIQKNFDLNPHLEKSLLGHGIRTAILSVLINQELQRTDSKPAHDGALLEAGLYHDIGKLNTEIRKLVYLNHSLKTEEKSKANEHIKIGHRFLFMLQMLCNRKNDESSVKSRDAVHFHHERLNGSGYLGVDGSPQTFELSKETRILAVADTFDAMQCSRTYREKNLTAQEALKEICHYAHPSRPEQRKYDFQAAEALKSLLKKTGNEYIFKYPTPLPKPKKVQECSAKKNEEVA